MQLRKSACFCFADFSFFDPSDPQCRVVLLDPCTTVPELFAVLRQWVPQVQKNIALIGNEVSVLLLQLLNIHTTHSHAKIVWKDDPLLRMCVCVSGMGAGSLSYLPCWNWL